MTVVMCTYVTFEYAVKYGKVRGGRGYGEGVLAKHVLMS